MTATPKPLHTTILTMTLAQLKSRLAGLELLIQQLKRESKG